MGRRKMKMTGPRNNQSRSKMRLMGATFLAITLAIISLMVLSVNTSFAQGLRRQIRMQKRGDKKLNPPVNNPKSKLSSPGERNEDPAATNEPESGTPKSGAQSLAPTSTTPAGATPIAGRRIQGGHSLDGIRQRGIRTFFTQEESSLLI